MKTTTERAAAETDAVEVAEAARPKSKMAQAVGAVKTWLAGLSFRTGVIVTAMCIPFYLLSFAALGAPWFSIATRGVLWTVFFGLAKTFQYGGLTILGKEGIVRLKAWFKGRKGEKALVQDGQGNAIDAQKEGTEDEISGKDK